MRRGLTTVALAGAFVVALAGSALAYLGSTGTFSLSTTGVAFNSAFYEFHNFETYDFLYGGYLRDTGCDGNGVFVHAKIEAYGYAPRLTHGGCNTQSYKSQWIYSNDITYASSGRVEACQDRGTLYTDLCNAKSFTNYVH